MSMARDFEAHLRDWMDEGTNAITQGVVSAVLDELGHTRQQRPLASALRWPPTRRTRRIGVIVIAATLLASGAYATLGRSRAHEPMPTRPPAPLAVLPGVPLSSFGNALRYVPPGTYVADEPFPIGVQLHISASNWVIYARSPDVIWITFRDRSAGIGLWHPANLYRDPCDWSSGLLEPPVGDGADAFIAAMAALPGLASTQPRDAVIGGLHARQITINAGDMSGCTDGAGFAWWSPSYVEQLRSDLREDVSAVMVGDQRLVLTSWTFPDTDQAVEQQLLELVASLRFGVAAPP